MSHHHKDSRHQHHEHRRGDPGHHHGHHHADQEHDHSKHESEGHSGSPSENEKMIKMVEHWIHHNEEHAKSYTDWADRARKMGQEQVGCVLEEVAAGTLSQNESFVKVLSLLKGGPPVR